MNLRNILIGIAVIPFVPVILVVMLFNELGKDAIQMWRNWK